MAEHSSVMDGEPKMSRYLPQALVATTLVVGAPVVAVWALRADQVVSSTLVAVVIGALLSVAVSFAGSAYWANSKSSRDVLFSELMIWGWLRRWRAEHKLSAALAGLSEQVVPAQAGATGLHLSMLEELAGALEAGDPYTRGHSRRVARYATMIAERMGLAADDVSRIRTAAVVHDVGKVYTPIEVLHKPGRLTDDEYTVVKAHPVDGARLVEALGDDRITAIVRHHHERLDGRGYPSGLSGSSIPLGARIVAVADTFDAITSARSYRPASPHRKALDILVKEAGTQLDADAVRAFRACYTGRRPFAIWMTLLAFPQRLSTSLGNTTTAGAVSISKAVMAASTVAVVGGAAASAAPLVPSAPSSKGPMAAIHSSGLAGPASTVMAAAPSAGSPTAHVAAAPSLGASLTTAAAAREHSALRRLRLRDRRFPKSAPGGGGPGRSNAPLRPVVAVRPSVVPTPSAAAPPVASSATATPVSTVAVAQSPAPAPVPVPVKRPAPAKAAGPVKTHGHGSSDKGKRSGTATGSSKRKGAGDGAPARGGSSGNKGNGKANGKANGSGATGGRGSNNGNGSGGGVAAGKGKGNGKGTAAGKGNGNGTGTGAADGAGAANGNGAAKGNGTANGKGNGVTDGGGGNGASNGNGNGSGVAAGTANGAAFGTSGNGDAGAAGDAGAPTGNGNASGSTGTNSDGNAGGNGSAGGNGNGDAGGNGSGNAVGTHHGP